MLELAERKLSFSVESKRLGAQVRGKPKPASVWHRVSVLPYQTEIFVMYRQTEI
jgi:hypothetical protein